MKITYIVNANIPDDWAHSVQIMNMCNAFAQCGHEVTLVVPDRHIKDQVDPFEYYGMKPIFSIIKVPCIDLYIGSPQPFFYWLRLISFYLSAWVYMRRHASDIVYSRDIYAALFFKKVALELHSFPRTVSPFKKYLFNRARFIIVLTSFIRQRLVKVGVDASRISVAPDGVDLDSFTTLEASVDSIKLPERIRTAQTILGYIGTLKTMGMEKGVRDCITALKYLPDSTKLLVVGGEKEDIDFYTKRALEKKVLDRVCFVGKVPHPHIASYIALCDILLAPFPENEHYSYFMSPLKIFEYMAGRKPIISTTLPSIKEVLKDDYNALLVPPSDTQALATAVERLCTEAGLAERISTQAYVDVTELYTWKKRAEGIIQHIHV